MLEYLNPERKQQNMGDLQGHKEKDDDEIIVEEECEQREK